MSTILVDCQITRKRGRSRKATAGIFSDNLVKTAGAKTRLEDRATLWTASVFGLLGNPRTGACPVYCDTPYTLRNIKPYLFTKTFRPWERCGAMLKAAYLNMALASADDGTLAYAITLRLGESQIRKAMGTRRGPLDNLRREIVRRLEVALNRTPDFWLSVEAFAVNGRDLHLHGAVGLFPGEEKTAREVLKGFSRYGIGTKARGRALDVRRRVPDVELIDEDDHEADFLHRERGGILPRIDDPRRYPGPARDAWEHRHRHLHSAWRWGSYALKDAARVADITGKSPLTENHNLLDRAKRLYERHRQIMRQHVNNMSVR